MANKVVYEDLGLGSLDDDVEQLLEGVLTVAATAVERGMKQNIVDRGFADTRATVNSVQVDQPEPLTRDIGPTTEYAIYGEFGFVQTHAWGRRLEQPIRHPGLHFARDALKTQERSFLKAIADAFKKLGRKR